MGLKSDRWIRLMGERGMIAPFEPHQISTHEGRRCVSYGTSSYGSAVLVRG
jgi:dCTP deaminase